MRKLKPFLLLLALIFSLILAGCSSGAASKGAEGDKWPHKNTTLIIPFDAGGSLDSMMRVIAKDLEQELGTSIRIDNRPGAATQIGTTQFVNQKRSEERRVGKEGRSQGEEEQ